MATGTERAAERLQTTTVVDLDFHLNLSPEVYVERVEDPLLREKLEYALPQSRGTSGWISSYAHHNDDGRNAHGHAETAPEIAAVMAEMDTDAVVVTPGMLGLPTARYPSLKTVVARAYNDYVVEEVLAPDRGIYGAIVTPQWDPDAAVAELKRLADHPGVVGAQAWYSPMAPLGGTEFDPLFAALVERDLPLLLHGSGFDSRFDMHSDAFRTRAESLFSWSHNAMVNVVNMLFTGVFEKFPTLRVAVQEGGVSWIPYVANHADEMYQAFPEDVCLTERMRDLGRQYFERMPSERLFENFWFTTQPIALPRPDQVGPLMELCRADETLLFSSDWPHHTLDTPTWPFDQPGIDADTRDRILHGNALDLFEIEP